MVNIPLLSDDSFMRFYLHLLMTALKVMLASEQADEARPTSRFICLVLGGWTDSEPGQ